MKRCGRLVRGLCAASAFSVGWGLAAPALARAAGPEPGLMARAAWSRPTATAAMAGVVYMTVTDSAGPTRLIGAATPVAQRAELHETRRENGMMAMVPVGSLPIAPGKPIHFHPGGYHIMLMGLAKPLSVGETFPLTLHFANGATITTTVTVRPMVPAIGGTMGGMTGG